MRFVSTRGECAAVSFDEALLAGLAPDGGLFMPERIPELPQSFFEKLPGLSLIEIADRVAELFLDDLEPAERRSLLADALDFEIPLVEISAGVFALELFHGPTLAFKDVGARLLARLMARSVRLRPRPLTVLVATSGDTGGAVAQAFHGVEGIRVVVLYPPRRVSTVQEKQFTTLGGNVLALAVEGDFDDCQRLVKEAFQEQRLNSRLGLTSANSINLARLLPQTFFYFLAAARLGPERRAVFSAPCGNFGNLTAGLMARAMGLETAGFVAATNVNDAVPRYLETGIWEPAPSRATISNAMDVGNPSNFQRILWLFGGDLDAIREVVTGSRHGDDETREVIRRVERETGYLLDPHSAVGYLGLEKRLAEIGEGVSGVVLSTAHPAKFKDEMEATLGRPVDLPERLARCLSLPTRAVPISPDLAALADALEQ